MTLPPPKTFRERMLDGRNRRSSNIEDRRGADTGISPLDSAGYGGITQDAQPRLDRRVPVHDVTRISPEVARMARWRAQGAFDIPDKDIPPIHRKRGLRHVRLGR